MSMFEKLKAPFPPDKISWRVGAVTKDKTKAMALAYIDARDVMERLDEVCGEEFWQCRYPHANGKTVCEIGIFILAPQYPEGQWIWKADGAGDSDIEAEKGALSDAFKRAAVRWGIGRYLYDMKSPWVRIDEWKKIVPEDMEKLHKLLPEAPKNDTVKLTDDGLLSNARAASLQGNKALDEFIKSLPKEMKDALKPEGKSLRAAADLADKSIAV